MLVFVLVFVSAAPFEGTSFVSDIMLTLFNGFGVCVCVVSLLGVRFQRLETSLAMRASGKIGSPESVYPNCFQNQ